jgi:hypothetical protein
MIDFNDSSGEPVFKGDTIKIIDHHNYIFNNLEAVIGWDEKNGMFTFNPIDKQLKGDRDFYGMGKFLKS